MGGGIVEFAVCCKKGKRMLTKTCREEEGPLCNLKLRGKEENGFNIFVFIFSKVRILGNTVFLVK